MKDPPSIFNDVLGPVMRGPSSSHSAAANRIGRLMRALAGEKIAKLVVRYDPNGSLVTTHKEQGSDLGLYSGILGWTPDDLRLPTYEQALKDKDIKIDLHYESYNAPHPNFYRLEAYGISGTVYRFDAISTGGGMIETISIDDIPFTSAGDYHHLLSWTTDAPEISPDLAAEIVATRKRGLSPQSQPSGRAKSSDNGSASSTVLRQPRPSPAPCPSRPRSKKHQSPFLAGW